MADRETRQAKYLGSEWKDLILRGWVTAWLDLSTMTATMMRDDR